MPEIGPNSLIPLAFGKLGPRGTRPQARPTAHPIGRRPLASLEQGERRPTGSRAAGLDGTCMLDRCGASTYESHRFSVTSWEENALSGHTLRMVRVFPGQVPGVCKGNAG